MLDTLKINKPHTTLVDQVEESLINYFKEQGLRPGSSIPPVIAVIVVAERAARADPV